MDIKDIQPRTGDITIVGEIVQIGDVREFEKFGKTGRVATAIVKDDTGQVKLSLWNDEIDRFKVGNRIMLTNGWAGEWQGEIQLSSGKFGKLELVEQDRKE